MYLKIENQVVFVDLHHYSPKQVCTSNGILSRLCWESYLLGARRLVLIHGHGRSRGKRPGRSGTNTGRLGLQIRKTLLNHKGLRLWVFPSTLRRSDRSSTSIKLRRNPKPSKTSFSEFLLLCPPTFTDWSLRIQVNTARDLPVLVLVSRLVKLFGGEVGKNE